MRDEQPQHVTPIQKSRQGLLLRFSLVLLVGTALVFGAQKITQRWIEAKLDAVGIQYTRLSVNLFRGELALADVDWHPSFGHVQIPEMRVSAGFSTLWTHAFTDVRIELGRVSATVSVGETKTVTPSTRNRMKRLPRFSMDVLDGATLIWSEVDFQLRSVHADCELRLDAGQSTLASGTHATSTSLMQTRCTGFGLTFETVLELDLSSLPKMARVRLNKPVTSSNKAIGFNFESAQLDLSPKPRMTLKLLQAQYPRLELKMNTVELWYQDNTVHALAEGGMTAYRRGFKASENSAVAPRVKTLALTRSLPIHFDWFRSNFLLDGQQITHVKHLEVQPSAVTVDLARGDSSLLFALTGLRNGWSASVLSMTGHLELADIDMLWPNNAMIDGAIGIDGQYDLKSGEGTLALRSERVRILHPSLSMMPFHLPSTRTRLFGNHKLGEQAGLLTGSFAMGRLSTRFAGAIGEEGEQFDFRWSGDDIPCEVLTSILPIEWVEELGVKFRGTASPSITFSGSFSALSKLRFRLRGIVQPCRVESVNIPWSKTGIELVNGAQRGSVSATADVDVLNRPFIKIIDSTYTDGARIQVGPASAEYTDITDLPPYVSAVMFLSEEVDFYKNLAVDLGLIQRALGLDLTHGRYVYGGSTITQQLVKNLILDRRKTLRRKFHEMLVADRLYQRVSKDRVLELYLNVIEFGPKVFGIEAAANFYFQKSSSALTVNESIFLAMLKPNPSRGADYVRRGRTPTHEYWFTRSEQLLRRLVEYGYLSSPVAASLPPVELFWTNGVSVPINSKK